MIKREIELNTINGLLKKYPVVGILGARQVGKTTLARMITGKKRGNFSYFDLENPDDFSRLSDPMLALKELKGLVVIDEIQRYPDLFPILRVLADRPQRPARFLILGSASPELLRQSAESLAGRIIYHELKGFSLDEIGISNHNRLWLRGGFPKSYLARSLNDSFEWRRGFIKTFLERDLPQLGITIRSTALHRFWKMLAHYHGQTWNASEFGRSFGVADTTVRNYLDLLTASLVIRQFPPWHENIKKRQVKAPKVYLKDSGILHTLLNLRSLKDLESHPKLGASWEGFILEQVVRRLRASADECFFWATHSGAELDLLIVRGRKRLGIEIKRTSSPKITPSMRVALKDLNLQSLYIIHAGEESFPMHKKIRALSIMNLHKDLHPFS
jgi:predicted AAA+ superfamily ATPase